MKRRAGDKAGRFDWPGNISVREKAADRMAFSPGDTPAAYTCKGRDPLPKPHPYLLSRPYFNPKTRTATPASHRPFPHSASATRAAATPGKPRVRTRVRAACDHFGRISGTTA